MSRVQDVKQGLQFSHRMYQLKAQHNLSQEDLFTLTEFVDELLPVSCNFFLFFCLGVKVDREANSYHLDPLE